MTTSTLTLTYFLLARIAEDEAWANYTEGPWLDRYGDSLDRMSPARVLAECETKRRIIAYHQADQDVRASVEGLQPMIGTTAILEYLALPYADHPDYRDEWRA